MAAYAALVSAMNTIDQIQLHPSPPFRLHTTHVETLTENITYLQTCLESYSQHGAYSKEVDPLEMRIIGAAHAVEDVIESHIAHHVYGVENMTANADKNISFEDFQGKRKAATDQFYQNLQMVIEEMDSLKKEVVQIKEKTGVPMRNLKSAPSLRSSTTGRNLTMVGFDDKLIEIMDKLTEGPLECKMVPIVGMGGTGKTTLARNVYINPLIQQHFDLRAWVTISQQYSMREILLDLLHDMGGGQIQMAEYDLGHGVHRKLFGRRYLIVVDDLWDIQALDNLRRFFPENGNGSRIMITSRISTNFESNNSYVLKMGFLSKDGSWTLFTNIVFGDESCPVELEEIGMKIVENCRGLPLSIVVVGGLLENSKHKKEYWEYIAQNLNSIVNSEYDESCLKILHLSYNELPLYLKPCFLYMGVFSEDKRIRVSELIKLWVSEGFLRPICGKTWEEVANEHLQELINRNLLIVHELGSTGNKKYCKVHDLLRDLCLRQSEKERFYVVIRQGDLKIPHDESIQRRIVIPESTSRENVYVALKNSSVIRSFLCDAEKVPPLRNFRLLRIMSSSHYDGGESIKEMFKIVNARCLVFRSSRFTKFPFSFNQWNLQTIIVKNWRSESKINIWGMPQLRHILFPAHCIRLEDLPNDNTGAMVLENLQTLTTVLNFTFSEEVIKRIPNIRKLKVQYTQLLSGEEVPDYCINNFSYLNKLESLTCAERLMSKIDLLENLAFPQSLKKLTMSIDIADWEDKLDKIGSLPLLEKLVLIRGRFPGEWITVEGQFPSLKFLKLLCCKNLVRWTTDSTHFPRLECLDLHTMTELTEIPSEIGEITTLKSIRLHRCSSSIVESAQKIREEQEETYGEVAVQFHIYRI